MRAFRSEMVAREETILADCSCNELLINSKVFYLFMLKFSVRVFIYCSR